MARRNRAANSPAGSSSALSGPTSTPAPTPPPLLLEDSKVPLDKLPPAAEVITSIVPSDTIQALVRTKTPFSGFIPSELETLGHVTTGRLLTIPIPSPTSFLAPVSANPSLQLLPDLPIRMLPRDIFADPISTEPPPPQIPRRHDHPAPRLGVSSSSGPIQTNKFYGNFHLGRQTSPTYLHPYSVAWPRGSGVAGSWGLAISHVEARQRVFGPIKPQTGGAAYFINPIGIHSVCISAQELGPDTVLTTEHPTDMSVWVSLRPNVHAVPAVQFPLVQGSAFITAIFTGARPLIQTGVFFRAVTRATHGPKPNVTKYKLHLEDGAIWLLYAHHIGGPALDLRVLNNGLAQATVPFHGTIQVAKLPMDGDQSEAEAIYDMSVGAYATGITISGAVHGTRGTYTFIFHKSGIHSSPLAMFALPHHVESFDFATSARLTGLRLQTTTKGVATAVVADSWTMVEPEMPVDMGFLPWSPTLRRSVGQLSPATREFIRSIAHAEVSEDMDRQTNLDSMYFSGKVSWLWCLC